MRSSDLEQAGRAAARLVSAREHATEERRARGDAPASWAKLAARVGGGETAPREVPEPEIELDAAGDRGWHVWLAWACEVAPAEGAFVVDHHGLLVASWGAIEADERDAIATRLVMALEQAALLDDDGGRSVCIDWRERAWTAARRGGIVVCLVSREPIGRDDLARVIDPLGRAAARRDA